MTHQPLTDQQLTDIDGHLAAYRQHGPTGFACCSAHPVADAAPELLAEVRRLRTENERMRHELEVMYGGAFDNLPPAAVSAAVAPPTQTALRDRIADTLATADGWVFAPGFKEGSPTYQGFLRQADAVLAVLPSAADWDDLVREADRLRRDGKALHARAEELDTQLAALRRQVAEPADRAAVYREAADRMSKKASVLTEDLHDLAHFVAKDRLREAEILDREAAELRRMADETATDQCECGCGQPGELVHGRRLAIPEPAAGARQDGAES
ncbi:hypothetical protein [Streptomyces althioticus]|uniref:hypothetical protein n=1 Tax=Streptomyces althioticus TaxID=83380 RepID=UPI0033EC3E1C